MAFGLRKCMDGALEAIGAGHAEGGFSDAVQAKF